MFLLFSLFTFILPSLVRHIQPLDVCWILLLLGVCHGLFFCGHLRPFCDPRDQKQNIHGDQPAVLQEGGSSGDPGFDPHRPAETEEDEWLRRFGTCFTGV